MANPLFDQSKYDLSYQKIRLAYQRPEIKVSVEVILSVFAIAFLLLVAVRPTLATVAELKKKIEDYEVVDKKLNSKITQLTRAEKELRENSADLYLFQKGVPDSFDYADLAKRVEIVAIEEGINLETLSFSRADITGEEVTVEKKDKKGSFVEGEFLLRFSLNGEEVKIISFLEKVEKLDRVIKLENVSVKKVEDKEFPGGKLRAIGEITGYYLNSELKENN